MSSVIAERYDAGTNEEYHAGEGISNSMLKVFIDNPVMFYKRFIEKSVPSPASTPDHIFGQQLHERVLEGRDITSVVLEPGAIPMNQQDYDAVQKKRANAVCIPSHVLNEQGHCKGSPYLNWAKDFKGRLLLKELDYIELLAKADAAVVVPEGTQVINEANDVQLIEMVDSLQRHETANSLLFTRGESEIPIRAVDADTGLMVRCKLDRADLGGANGFVCDLKTVRDASPQGFAASVFRFGYHRQQVFYSKIVEQLTGFSLPFYFVAVEKEFPFRVEVYQLVDEWLAIGEREITKAMAELKQCSDSKTWNYPHYGSFLTLPVPSFVRYQNTWEVE
jgi:hypothetical protein